MRWNALAGTVAKFLFHLLLFFISTVEPDIPFLKSVSKTLPRLTAGAGANKFLLLIEILRPGRPGNIWSPVGDKRDRECNEIRIFVAIALSTARSTAKQLLGSPAPT